MINGEIDLSIGAVYLFAPFMFHEFHVAGVPLLVALALALTMCLLVGLVNGFFTTLSASTRSSRRSGCCSALTGFTLIISDAQPVSTPGTDVLGEPTTFSRSSAAAPTPS